MLHSAQNQAWKCRIHLVPSLSPSFAEITVHAITRTELKCQEERTKTSYLLNINLITTRLNIAANIRVMKRFFYGTSQIGRTTSRCASTRHNRILSSIFSKIWSIFNQHHHNFCCRVLHTFSSTISIRKKQKTEVGAEVGEGVKKNPEKIWPYLFGILFNSLPN